LNASKRIPTATFFVALTALVCTAQAADVPDVRSAIFVAVDLSQTWHRKDTGARNEALLDTINQGVVSLAGRIVRPSFVAYSTIGEQGLAQTFICSAVYHSTLLQGRNDTVLKTRRELGSFLGVCGKAARARSSAQLTDISGGLHFLSRQLGDHQESIERYVVVLSDMKEERGSRGVAPLNLKGFKVLLVYRALPEDDRDPRALEARLSSWRKRLTDAGATVTSVIDTGLVARSIANLANGTQ
jgi:hypothetical protein